MAPQVVWSPGDPCPYCGDPVLPNRERRSEKSPSFKCHNPNCDNGQGKAFASWYGLPPKDARTPAAPRQAPAQHPSQPYQPPGNSSAPRGSWGEMRAVYEACAKLAGLIHPKASPDAQVTACNCLFIEANKRNLGPVREVTTPPVTTPIQRVQPARAVAGGPGMPEFGDFPPPHNDQDSDSLPF